MYERSSLGFSLKPPSWLIGGVKKAGSILTGQPVVVGGATLTLPTPSAPTPAPYIAPAPAPGVDTNTMLLLGLGLVAFMMLGRRS